MGLQSMGWTGSVWTKAQGNKELTLSHDNRKLDVRNVLSERSREPGDNWPLQHSRKMKRSAETPAWGYPGGGPRARKGKSMQIRTDGFG